MTSWISPIWSSYSTASLLPHWGQKKQTPTSTVYRDPYQGYNLAYFCYLSRKFDFYFHIKHQSCYQISRVKWNISSKTRSKHSLFDIFALGENLSLEKPTKHRCILPPPSLGFLSSLPHCGETVLLNSITESLCLESWNPTLVKIFFLKKLQMFGTVQDEVSKQVLQHIRKHRCKENLFSFKGSKNVWCKLRSTRLMILNISITNWIF